MGNATWTRAAYASRSADYSTKSRDQVFQSRNVLKDFDPKNIILRESVDSEANPESTAIIVGLDVTGSMGFIAEHIAKKGLGTLIESIIDTKPVTDPHLMMMAIGDIQCDRAPLQVTQFEADIRIADQLTDLWLEGGGGGNSYESYDLPWIFAARKTQIDCFDKRGKKGYLFTIGDELPPRTATNSTLRECIGVGDQQDRDAAFWLKEAQEKYNVFHVVVEEGWYFQQNGENVRKRWTDMLGKKAIFLKDHNCISEVITAVIQVNEGMNPEDAITATQGAEAQKAVEYALYGAGQ
jgi:hypothetical protein